MKTGQYLRPPKVIDLNKEREERKKTQSNRKQQDRTGHNRTPVEDKGKPLGKKIYFWRKNMSFSKFAENLQEVANSKNLLGGDCEEKTVKRNKTKQGLAG